MHQKMLILLMNMMIAQIICSKMVSSKGTVIQWFSCVLTRLCFEIQNKTGPAKEYPLASLPGRLGGPAFE